MREGRKPQPIPDDEYALMSTHEKLTEQMNRIVAEAAEREASAAHEALDDENI